MPLHLLQFAKKLAHDAGLMAMEYQKRGFKTKTKGSHVNLVTDADEACNKLIVDTIKSNFPDHTIISEESGIKEGKGDYKWIIDPIDGTANFAHGIPYYAVSIAVIHKGQPIIGVVDIPGTKEYFWAKKGEGAYLGRKKIHVSKVADIKQGFFSGGVPYERGAKYKKSIELFDAFYKPSIGVRRTGSAAIDMCYVAAGRFDGLFAYDLEVWDIAAAKIIIEEAGGIVTNMDNTKLNPKHKNILASNGVIHQSMVELLAKHAA